MIIKKNILKLKKLKYLLVEIISEKMFIIILRVILKDTTYILY